jgi:sugar-specific transcriptional regulator TrmB
MFSPLFHRLGLTKNEEQIYLFLLEYGAAVASTVGKRLGIKRLTAYAALESLEKKGLAETYVKHKVTYFEAVGPDALVNLTQRKVNEAEMLQKEVRAAAQERKKLEEKHHKPVVEVRGKMRFYQGLEAVQGLIDETLVEDEKEQLCFGLNSYHVEHPSEDWGKYTKLRVEKGMHVRSIQPDIEAAKEYKARDRKELRETRLVPHSEFPADCELNVIGDMIALFSTHGDEPVGMKLYNKDFSRVLTSLFELAWRKSSDYNKRTD